MNWVVAENQATYVCVFGSWTILLQIYFVKSSTILHTCQFCAGRGKYLTIFFISRTVWENVWWWKGNLLGSEVPFSSLKQRCILSNFCFLWLLSPCHPGILTVYRVLLSCTWSNIINVSSCYISMYSMKKSVGSSSHIQLNLTVKLLLCGIESWRRVRNNWYL